MSTKGNRSNDEQRRSAAAPKAPALPVSSEPLHEADSVAGFAGPGYGGFAGSAGYSGAGIGGVTGGYAGGGSFDVGPWRPSGKTHHDDRIREDAMARLRMNEDIDANEIEVWVEAGSVTLSGAVENRHMKHIARDIVESVPGVASVHNRLRVNDPGSAG